MSLKRRDFLGLSGLAALAALPGLRLIEINQRLKARASVALRADLELNPGVRYQGL